MWVDRVGHKSHAEGASFHILCISPRDPVSAAPIGYVGRIHRFRLQFCRLRYGGRDVLLWGFSWPWHCKV